MLRILTATLLLAGGTAFVCAEDAAGMDEDFRVVRRSEAYPGRILFSGTADDYDALSQDEQFALLFGRRVSFEDASDPQYDAFYVRMLGNPKLIHEFRAKRLLAEALCRLELFGKPITSEGRVRVVRTPISESEARERAEKAAALLADVLSEDEWGRERLGAEEKRLSAQGVSAEELSAALARQSRFYEIRRRLMREVFLRRELLSDFAKLLLRAYPSDEDAMFRVFDESLIREKTGWRFSELCKRCGLSVSVERYDALRRAEILREEDAAPIEKIAEIAYMGEETDSVLWEKSREAWTAVRAAHRRLGKLSREEIEEETRKIKDIFAEALGGYEGSVGELDRLGAIRRLAVDDAGRRAEVAAYARQCLVGAYFADQGRTFMRFVDLLVAAYPEDFDKALSVFDESLIRQKTAWGEMSELYALAHPSGNSDAQRNLEEIRAAEARRERRGQEILERNIRWGQENLDKEPQFPRERDLSFFEEKHLINNNETK